ncbi:unnamed protein product, partial [Prorocentrum cordatum]
GDEQAIKAVTSCLRNTDGAVRQATMQALEKVADRGDERAIGAVLAELAHENGQVRWAAVWALAQVANRNNQGAIEALTKCLEDKDCSKAASEVLRLLQ